MSTVTKVAIVIVVLGAVIVAALVWEMQSSNESSSVAASTMQDGELVAGNATGLAQSASKVRTHVEWIAGSDSPVLAVHLEIAKGWHVNANPVSLKFLVPTEVTVTAGGVSLPVAADYPQGEDSGIRLEGTAILVYSNGAVIHLTLAPHAQALLREAGSMEVSTRVQACSDNGICLAPSTLRDTMRVEQ